MIHFAKDVTRLFMGVLFLTMMCSLCFSTENRITTFLTGAGSHHISIVENGVIIERVDTHPLIVRDYCIDSPRNELFLILGREDSTLGERLAIYSIENGKIKRSWLGQNRGYNPWKIRTGDVDGDSKADVIVSVWKKARFHPVSANRLFVYDWDGEELFPKWLGSRLSLPFIDFSIRDITGDGVDELISLEIQRDKLKRIIAYQWNGFGFLGYKEIANDLKINNLDEAKLNMEK